MLFLREGTLLSQTFDARQLGLTNEPVEVVDQVGGASTIAFGLFSASSKGVLVYRAGASRDLQLTWYDRRGRFLGTVGEPGRYAVLALSPDGARAAVSRTDPQSGNQDIWLIDLGQDLTTRFTSDPAVNSQPVWSPDGSSIAFISNRGGTWGVYRKATNGVGSEELLYKSSNAENLTDWSRDGRFLLYHSLGRGAIETEWVLPLYDERKPFPCVRTNSLAIGGRFSPDGRWIAYISNETGRNEIYIQSLSSTLASSSLTPGASHLVSRGTLGMPRWRGDGKELFYLAPDGRVMAVELNTTPDFHASAPVPLFEPPPDFLQASANGLPGTLATAAADGKRFLFAMPLVQHTREEFTVVLNWTASLKK
jgi:Tol biopolymer transport system component